MQMMRMLMSAVFWSVLLPIEMVKPSLTAAKKHADLTRGQSGHRLGPPHPHVWRAFLLEVTGKIDQLDQAAEPVKAACQTVNDYTKDFLATPSRHLTFIKQARAKALKENMGLIMWQLSPITENAQEIDRALLLCMEAVKGDIRSGTAPPDPMERAIQKRIDVVSKRIVKAGGRVPEREE